MFCKLSCSPLYCLQFSLSMFSDRERPPMIQAHTYREILAGSTLRIGNISTAPSSGKGGFADIRQCAFARAQSPYRGKSSQESHCQTDSRPRLLLLIWLASRHQTCRTPSVLPYAFHFFGVRSRRDAKEGTHLEDQLDMDLLQPQASP